MCPLDFCQKEYLYFSSLKKHLARNHTKLFKEKYAKWSKEEILLENEDSEISEEDISSVSGKNSSQDECHNP